ncbi:hypothetical protein ACIQVE_04155 [Pseudomonas sp. NPDC098747]|uniref:hypothetical protein n=1 Tax=Pseudomonas sp. NPDC098747 TaxID=3364487 RepID=UPI003839E5DC
MSVFEKHRAQFFRITFTVSVQGAGKFKRFARERSPLIQSFVAHPYGGHIKKVDITLKPVGAGLPAKAI